MSGLLVVALTLASGLLLAVEALGRLFPEVSYRNRCMAVFYLFSTYGALAFAWRVGQS